MGNLLKISDQSNFSFNERISSIHFINFIQVSYLHFISKSISHPLGCYTTSSDVDLFLEKKVRLNFRKLIK